MIHTHFRLSQGLDSFGAVADLKWAFDVANIPAMLKSAFDAEVWGEDWLLLDDIL